MNGGMRMWMAEDDQPLTHHCTPPTCLAAEVHMHSSGGALLLSQPSNEPFFLLFDFFLKDDVERPTVPTVRPRINRTK